MSITIDRDKLASVLQQIMPHIPALPAIFDYIVDIYSDKIVITNPDGSTTQLSTIADLNNWLSNITGKKIMVNVNTKISEELDFTPNEYWIFGEEIDGGVFLLEGKHTVVSFAHISFLGNYDPNNRPTDVSGSRIYIVTADWVWIEGLPSRPVRDIRLVVGYAEYTSLEFAEGDYYASGHFIHAECSVLRNAFINATFLCLEDVRGRDNKGIWSIVSHVNTCNDIIDVSEVYRAELRLTYYSSLYVSPGQSIADYLPRVPGRNIAYIKSLQVGIRRCSRAYCVLDPLPEGVTYTVDLNEGKIVVTNNRSEGISVRIIVEIIAMKYW